MIEKLQRRVATQSDDLRAAASQALDKLIQHQDVLPMVNLLKIRNKVYMTDFAVIALYYFLDDARVHDLFIGLLTHSNWHVRSVAANEVGKHGYLDAIDLLITMLNDRYVRVRLEVIGALNELGDPRAISPLIPKLNDPHKYVRSNAAESLAKFRYEPAIPLLIELLQDREWFVRTSAVEALAELKASVAVEPIVALLKDRKEVVRRLAAEGLGKIGDPQAVIPLIEALKERQAAACSAIIAALGEIGDQRAVKPLLRVLKRRSFVSGFTANVHSSVIWALGKLGIIEPIIEALENERSLVRSNAALALGRLQEQRAIPFLVKTLNDPECWGHGRYPVRDAAAKALAQLGYIEEKSE
jgi:HEAT repeat protein